MKARYLITSDIEQLFAVCNGKEFRARDLPENLVPRIRGWKSDCVILTVTPKTRAEPAVYRISPDTLRLIRGRQIVNDTDNLAAYLSGAMSKQEFYEMSELSHQTFNRMLQAALDALMKDDDEDEDM